MFHIALGTHKRKSWEDPPLDSNPCKKMLGRESGTEALSPLWPTALGRLYRACACPTVSRWELAALPAAVTERGWMGG